MSFVERLGFLGQVTFELLGSAVMMITTHKLHITLKSPLKEQSRDFSVGKTPNSQCGGPGFDPWSGN